MILGTELALAAVMAASVPHFSITMLPAHVSTDASYSSSNFLVEDTGQTTLHIQMKAEALRPIQGHPKSFAPVGAFQGATISPSRFSLSPGHKRVVRVTVRSDDAWRHEIGIAAVMTAGKVSNGASVQEAATARYSVRQTAPFQPGQKPIHQAPPPSNGGTPWLQLWFIVAAFAVLVAFVAYILRRGYYRRRETWTDKTSSSL